MIVATEPMTKAIANNKSLLSVYSDAKNDINNYMIYTQTKQLYWTTLYNMSVQKAIGELGVHTLSKTLS